MAMRYRSALGAPRLGSAQVAWGSPAEWVARGSLLALGPPGTLLTLVAGRIVFMASPRSPRGLSLLLPAIVLCWPSQLNLSCAMPDYSGLATHHATLPRAEAGLFFGG